MGTVIVILIILLAVVVVSLLWVNAIDKAKNDPEWQQHKDDPDYWDWP